MKSIWHSPYIFAYNDPVLAHLLLSASHLFWTLGCYFLGDEPAPQTVLHLEFGDFTTTGLPQWSWVMSHTTDMKRGTWNKKTVWTLANFLHITIQIEGFHVSFREFSATSNYWTPQELNLLRIMDHEVTPKMWIGPCLRGIPYRHAWATRFECSHCLRKATCRKTWSKISQESSFLKNWIESCFVGMYV